MKCANCGNELHHGEKFCARCGIQVAKNPAGYQHQEQPPAPSAGNQPAPQPAAPPAGYQPAPQPPAPPMGYQPTPQPQAPPMGYQPTPQPQAPPTDFQPAPQPPTSPADFQPAPQPPAPPADYQPAPQPPVQQAGYFAEPDTGNVKSGFTQKIKNMPLKKVLTIAVPIVIIIVALIIAIPLVINPGSFAVKDNITFFKSDGVVFISGNNNPKFSIRGDFETTQISIDGSKAVILTDDWGSSGGTLWFVTTSDSVKIADDVLDFQLSDSGSGVIYFTDYNSRNDTASLYLYDTSAKKSSLVTEETMYQGYYDPTSACISPNGKTIGYISDYDSRNLEFTGYLSVDGKPPEKLGINTAAIAVSDGGKYLYYVKIDDDGYGGSLHVRSGNNNIKLIPDFSGFIYLSLSKDYSQLVFNYQDKAFISRNGGERERISGSTIGGFLTPRGTRGRYIKSFSAGITAYRINSFTNHVAFSDEGLVYIDNSLETSRISSSSDNYSSAEITDNGKILLYINNSGRLSAIDPTVPYAERRDLARNVQGFVATNDASSIYYVNEDDELWHIKNYGQPVKISDDVSYRRVALPYSGNKVFFLVDYSSRKGGELFYSDNGDRRVRVPGADEVMELWSTPTNMFFKTYDGEVFRSNGNEMFYLFAEDVD